MQERTDKKNSSNPLNNQRGAALVLALAMLTIMSILGAWVLSSSTTEIGISGNYRTSQQAFYAADRAVEYAMIDEVIYSTVTPANPSLSLNATMAENIQADTGNSGLRQDAPNQVDFLTSGPLPPGTGSDPTYFQSRYYAISVTGAGPNNSTARIDAQVARVVPK
jgi:type IV pilus assembly protein PilX